MEIKPTVQYVPKFQLVQFEYPTLKALPEGHQAELLADFEYNPRTLAFKFFYSLENYRQLPDNLRAGQRFDELECLEPLSQERPEYISEKIAEWYRLSEGISEALMDLKDRCLDECLVATELEIGQKYVVFENKHRDTEFQEDNVLDPFLWIGQYTERGSFDWIASPLVNGPVVPEKLEWIKSLNCQHHNNTPVLAISEDAFFTYIDAFKRSDGEDYAIAIENANMLLDVCSQ